MSWTRTWNMSRSRTGSTVTTFLAWLLFHTVLHGVHSWDFAVTIDNHIEFYNNNGTEVGIVSNQFTDLGPLAFDPVHQILYFADTKHENATLFSFHLIGTKDIEHLVMRNFSDNVLSVDVDPVSRRLFWTDGKNKSIYWQSQAPGAESTGTGSVLIQTLDQEPKSIAVDRCRSLIFWTNIKRSKPTIESATTDGDGRTVVIDSKLKNPIALVVNEKLAKLYWIDIMDIDSFKIESANYDGSNRTLVYKGNNQQPYDLAINDNFLLWTDWIYSSVWRLPLASEASVQPERILKFKRNLPMGIITNVALLERIGNVDECISLKETILNRTSDLTNRIYDNHKNIISNMKISLPNYSYCLNGGVLEMNKGFPDKCNCLKGYSGPQCEISLCHNYCLNGTCILDKFGLPQCRCNNGFFGKRCENKMCEGYCLNNGTCSINDNKIVCQCSSNWTGTRCETQRKEKSNSSISLPVAYGNIEDAYNNSQYGVKNSSEANSLHDEMLTSNNCLEWEMTDPIMLVLLILVVILSIVIIGLSLKIIQLKRRPRIKKRIIVSKNVTPLQYRPNPPQCEITIENCCNMNICETPCFEPEGVRTVVDVSHKEEKKNLLLNMEHPENLY